MYSSVEEVINYTGVRPEDFGMDAPELFSTIQGWLEEATSLINQDRQRDYEAEGNVPDGIHSIAKRIVGNMVSIAMVRRESPVVKIGDWSVNLVKDDVFTSAIKKDLKMYPKKAKFSINVVGEYDVDEL